MADNCSGSPIETTQPPRPGNCVLVDWTVIDESVIEIAAPDESDPLLHRADERPIRVRMEAWRSGCLRCGRADPVGS